MVLALQPLSAPRYGASSFPLLDFQGMRVALQGIVCSRRANGIGNGSGVGEGHLRPRLAREREPRSIAIFIGQDERSVIKETLYLNGIPSMAELVEWISTPLSGCADEHGLRR